LQYPRPTVIHFEGEINSLHHCELVFHVSNNVEMMMMVLYFQVPNMESEPTTSDRLDKILELELTGAQDIIESLMLANSSYDHRIPTSTLRLQR
jgi:hypothetical protein